MWLDTHRYENLVCLTLVCLVIFCISTYSGWMHAKKDEDWKLGALVTLLLVCIATLYIAVGVVPLYRANALDYAKIQILTGK